jgi:cytochrome c oxidase assembly protein subunit 11
MTEGDARRKNRNLALNCLAIVVGMVLLAYASVPLYRIFCSMTGFGGTTQFATALPTHVVAGRKLKIQFNSDVSPGLPWKFHPQQREVEVMVGEDKLVFFDVESLASQLTYGIASYNVTPLKVGAYFNKIKCFCYSKQPMEPYQKATMPVTFFINPDFATDPDMRDVDTVTLSYTFFPAADKKPAN